MTLNDDEEFASASSQEAYTRADKGKLKKLREKIANEHGKQAEGKAQNMSAQKDLLKLQTQLAGLQDEETKRLQQEQEAAEIKSAQASAEALETDGNTLTQAQLEEAMRQAKIEEDQSAPEDQQQMG